MSHHPDTSRVARFRSKLCKAADAKFIFARCILGALLLFSFGESAFAQNVGPLDSESGPNVVDFDKIEVHGVRLPDSLATQNYRLERFSQDSLLTGLTEHFQVNFGAGGKDSASEGACPVQRGDPIVISTGTLFESETDFATGGEMGLFLNRRYNSKAPTRPGIFGNGWVSNFDKRLVFMYDTGQSCTPAAGYAPCPDFSASTMRIYGLRPDGRSVLFLSLYPVVVYTEDKPAPIARLVREGGGVHTLYTEDNKVEVYLNGLIQSEKDSHGIGWTYVYGGQNGTQLQTVTHTSGKQVNFTWSGYQLVSVTDPAGNVYSYAYDSTGGNRKLISATLAGSPTTVVSYAYISGTSRLSAKYINNALYSSWTYDSAGRADSSERVGGIERYSFVYTAAADGNITKVVETNPLNKTATYVFTNNKLASISEEPSAHCAAAFKEIAYDTNGYESAVEDFRGNVTTYNYAPNGQLLEKVEAAGSPLARTTTIAWDPSTNRQANVTVVGDSKVSYTFTADNRIATRTVTNLSSNGVPNQSRTTTYTYTKHANGMLSSVTIDGPLAGISDSITYTYSPAGDRTEVRNGLGHATTFADHNALGLPGRVTGPNGDVIEYTYDGRGRTTRERRYRNGTASDTTYRYGASGPIESVTTPDGLSITFVYDAALRKIEEFTKGADGMYARKQYAYNSMSLPTSIQTIRASYPWNTKIVGNIDGLSVDGVGDYVLNGWACSTGDKSSIPVHMYLGGAAGTGQFIGSYTAALPSEPAVATSCQAGGAAYRFSIPLPMTLRSAHSGKSIYVHGISPAGAGNLLISASGAFLVPAPPSAPTLTVPASSATGSYAVSWGAIANVAKYQLQERPSGGSWTEITNALVTSASISGKANGTYEYQIRACTGSGCGAFSTVKSVVVLFPPASAPSITLPTTNSTGGYTASWTAVPTATTYELQESLNGGGWTTIPPNLSSTSKVISGKSSGVYGYQVRACNGSGCSAYSVVASITVTLPPASAPTLTVPATVTSGSYTVSWTAVGGATSYKLDESSNGGAWTQIHNASGMSKAVSGKTAGTYAYRVTACNGGGCGPTSTVVSVVDIDPPTGAPVVSAPASNTTGSYTVSWTSVAGATTYSLAEQVNSGAWAGIYSNSGTSFGLSGKAIGTYSYRASACNSAGCGPVSSTVSVQRTNPPTPATPALTARYTVTQIPPIYTTFTMSWTGSIGATSYELQRIAGSATTIYLGPNGGYQYTNTGGGPLINGVMPKFQVRACNEGGCSAWSTQVTPSG
jgi:YD repeat-containing protein